MYYIYALSSTTRNYIYVGMTRDVEARVLRHNKGWEKTTRAYKPFVLIFTEIVENTRVEARKREKYWKSGVGKEKLRLIRDENNNVPK